MKAWRMTIMAALAMGGAVNAIAADPEDYLDPTRPYKTEFVVSHHIGENTVYASARFLAPNSRELPASDTLTVNGIPLKGKPHMKQGWLSPFRIGYAYGLVIPLAERYEFVLRHAATGAESRFEILPRRFVPKMPARISRRSDLRIAFEGPPVTQGEELSSDITIDDTVSPKEMQRLYRVVSKGVGNEIILSAAQAENPRIKAGLADVPPGPAILVIGVHSRRFIDNRHRLTFVISQRAPVIVE